MMCCRAVALALISFAFVAVAHGEVGVVQWLNDLADANADIRAGARGHLLQISRDGLLQLKQLVAAGAASRPSQREALYEIVIHAFLATEPYPSQPDGPSFFGLRLRPLITGDEVGAGVRFDRRLIGFPAYVALEDGDIILGVKELPDLPLNAVTPLQPIRERFKAGQIVHLLVLRDDRAVYVPMKLAATPIWPTDNGDITPQLEREQSAQLFWEREFLPLLNARTQ